MSRDAKGIRQKPRRYAPTTIIAAQRRVLRSVAGVIAIMGDDERARLRTNGTSLWTLDELLEHITAAAEMKARKER